MKEATTTKNVRGHIDIVVNHLTKKTEKKELDVDSMQV